MFSVFTIKRKALNSLFIEITRNYTELHKFTHLRKNKLEYLDMQSKINCLHERDSDLAPTISSFFQFLQFLHHHFTLHTKIFKASKSTNFHHNIKTSFRIYMSDVKCCEIYYGCRVDGKVFFFGSVCALIDHLAIDIASKLQTISRSYYFEYFGFFRISYQENFCI